MLRVACEGAKAAGSYLIAFFFAMAFAFLMGICGVNGGIISLFYLYAFYALVGAKQVVTSVKRTGSDFTLSFGMFGKVRAARGRSTGWD